MGETMCFLLLFVQPFSILASSGAILIIALDRYRTAVHATMKRWNPNLWHCLVGIALLWGAAVGKEMLLFLFIFLRIKILLIIIITFRCTMINMYTDKCKILDRTIL